MNSSTLIGGPGFLIVETLLLHQVKILYIMTITFFLQLAILILVVSGFMMTIFILQPIHSFWFNFFIICRVRLFFYLLTAFPYLRRLNLSLLKGILYICA